MSLPTAKNFSLDPDAIIDIANVHRATDLTHRKVVEVSGLASRQKQSARDTTVGEQSGVDPVRRLYADMLRHSIEAGHDLWLLNADKLLLRDLRRRLGEDQVSEVGDARQYMGPPTVPAAINPKRVVEEALGGDNEENKAHLRAVFQGIDASNSSADMRHHFDENGIEYRRDGRVKRLIRDQKTLAYGAILGYSTVRALPAAAVEEFSGSVPLLWAIDIGTAAPYTWGVIETFSRSTPLSRNVGRVAAKATGVTVAGASFVAPYAYFYSQGESYPGYVNAVLAGLIGVAGVSEALKYRHERRLRQQLASL